MSSAKLAAAAGLAAVVLSGCGTAAKPVAGSIGSRGEPSSRGRVDDPRTNKPNHVKCLRQEHLPVVKVGATGLQIGPLPAGPTVVFEPTPGAAQFKQMDGVAPGAEVIGSALLYPNQASGGELKKIEDCLAKGVAG